jgi:hypothetical protein
MKLENRFSVRAASASFCAIWFASSIDKLLKAESVVQKVSDLLWRVGIDASSERIDAAIEVSVSRVDFGKSFSDSFFIWLDSVSFDVGEDCRREASSEQYRQQPERLQLFPLQQERSGGTGSIPTTIVYQPPFRDFAWADPGVDKSRDEAALPRNAVSLENRIKVFMALAIAQPDILPEHCIV